MEQCLFPYTQTGSTGHGLYAIAFAVDLAAGNNPCDIIYDQSVMCSHLSQCILENRISIFPQHRLCPDKNVQNMLTVQKNGHLLKKLVLRNNLRQQHHLYQIFQIFLQHSGYHRLVVKTQRKLW